MAAAFDEKVAKPLQDAADEACGTSDAGSGLSAALWARESHKDGHYAKQHDENTEEKIRYGKGVVHGSSPFLARKRLMINDDMASPPPASIASQFGLSNEENTGATTPIAKNTFPALSKILESRLIWPTVNTGSFQMYRTPNDSIASYSTTIPQNMSTDFSLIPRVFAAGGSAPSGGSGLGCAAARMAVVMAKGVAGFIENSSWQMPHRAAVQYLGGSRLYLQNKTTGDQDGTGGTSYVPAASSQTRQPRLTEAFDRGGGGERTQEAEPATQATPVTRVEEIARPYAAKLENLVEQRVTDPLNNAADEACGTGFLPDQPRLIADMRNSLFAGGLFGRGTENQEGKQENRYREEHIGSSSIPQNFTELFETHRSALLSNNHNAISNDTIPNGKWRNKSDWNFAGVVARNPGLMTSIPNQPDARLTNNDPNTFANVLVISVSLILNLPLFLMPCQPIFLNPAGLRSRRQRPFGRIGDEVRSRAGSQWDFSRKIRRIFRQSYKMPWRWLEVDYLGIKLGSGGPPPPPVDEYERAASAVFTCLLAFLAKHLTLV